MNEKSLFAKVIPPLKLRKEIFYAVPDKLKNSILTGSQVKINLAGKEYIAVVSQLSDHSGLFKGKIKEIISITDLPIISESDFEFWRWISDYYMCALGEVYKAAYPGLLKDVSGKKRRLKEIKKSKEIPLPQMSFYQQTALDKIRENFINKTPVFLRGEPGSGKSEIYFRLADEYLKMGKSVLFLLPEIAVSHQITKRAQSYFSNKLLISHSRQTHVERMKILELLSSGVDPYIVIGVRSAILLPFRNLGLIIVDEEQEYSYKQFEPAPRYNARDSSMILARIHKADIILGSSTPSFESLENIKENKISQVNLLSRFHDIPAPDIKIIDTGTESRRGKMKGFLSGYLIESIKKALTDGDQVLLISAKKYVSAPELQLTTKILEEQLNSIFPESSIVRFDNETSAGKADEKRILNDFATHKYEIMVSNKMTGKGFHFPGLNLAAIIFAESLINNSDFRSGEKALQTIYQIAGRAGREKKQGLVIVQTASLKNPIFKSIRFGEDTIKELMNERLTFEYPPFVRLINLNIKGKNFESVKNYCEKLSHKLSGFESIVTEGPFDPGGSENDFRQRFIIKIRKNKSSVETKLKLGKTLESIGEEFPGVTTTVDVDPS